MASPFTIIGRWYRRMDISDQLLKADIRIVKASEHAKTLQIRNPNDPLIGIANQHVESAIAERQLLLDYVENGSRKGIVVV